MRLDGKTVLIGVSGGIAAYKTAYLVSRLKKAGADVNVIMTENATKFISPLTFETLSGNRCSVDTFARDFKYDVEHVSLAKKADLFMVAPATADVIAKFAYGLADDMLTTTFLASDCPKYVVPAMNTRMYENPLTQENIRRLKHYGIHVVDPASGYLACGDTGAGKMPEPEDLYKYIERRLARDYGEMAGKRVIVTAGATMEHIDPVRFITNHSTGKMGFAIAKDCAARGADVTVVTGHVEAELPAFCHIIRADSAEDMYREVMERADSTDYFFMAAAVADFTPMNVASEKIKKHEGGMTIELERTQDILASVGASRRDDQFICGFSMETEHMLENSRAKLAKKNCDMICANNLREKGAGFGTDTNIVTLITKDDETRLDIMSKEDVAKNIVDKALKLTGVKAE
ncbi:MAG: bifunctional phosphopantothenoylcysteine decarboxylase/phosphopantothenate--cysteine ligase CoaBC [Eubacteriales bacterium]|nr:bifunctional phosphopantothenoylcysteine decarboxylase/phosphopantothenate--cysteine ligase CoaBC [Eubacteriales bacterium]